MLLPRKNFSHADSHSPSQAAAPLARPPLPRRAALAAVVAPLLAAAAPAAAAPSLGKNRAVELARAASERRAAMKAKVEAAKETKQVKF